MQASLKAAIAAVAMLAACCQAGRAEDRLVGTTCQELYDNCVQICIKQGFPRCQDCPNGKKSCDETGVWRSYFATIKVPPGRPK